MNNLFTNFSIDITNIPAAPPPSRVPLQTRQSVPAVNVLKYYHNVLNINLQGSLQLCVHETDGGLILTDIFYNRAH